MKDPATQCSAYSRQTITDLELREKLARLFAGCSRPNHFHVRLQADDDTQTFPDDRVIVDTNYANSGRLLL